MKKRISQRIVCVSVCDLCGWSASATTDDYVLQAMGEHWAYKHTGER